MTARDDRARKRAECHALNDSQPATAGHRDFYRMPQKSRLTSK
jgi:hypothetical protein